MFLQLQNAVKASNCALLKAVVILWVWKMISLGMNAGLGNHTWRNTLLQHILTHDQCFCVWWLQEGKS